MRRDQDPLAVVRDYHERTKHRLDRAAASPGYMDWANQPDPFRSFAGAEAIPLPHPDLRQAPSYDGVFRGLPPAAALDAQGIGRLLYHSLALSAWKQAPGTARWSLRINPSSGDLHPTEGYLISAAVPGLLDAPGVFHYAPYRHQLERRCRLSADQWARLTAGLPAPCLLVGLTSIHWRESWKYGERAFRYCHHDVGHAIGAVALAAATLGWRARLLDGIADADLDRLLGTHLQSGVEAEHGDCLLLLAPGDRDVALPALSADAWAARIPEVELHGEPNRLSREHADWPVIDAVSRAARTPPPAGAPAPESGGEPGPAPLPGAGDRAGATPGTAIRDREQPAEGIIRQRRSAVDMDGVTALDRATFYHMLLRTLPRQRPFTALPWPPRVALALFVHRIDGLDPGLYVLARAPEREQALRRALGPDFEWLRPEACPEGLGLHRLAAGDTRRVAKLVSCNQDIAADGAFSLGMLADFDAALDAAGARAYPRLHWEAGLVGQVLYLEAETAGVRATGIGCFLDDLMHEVLGIGDHAWQSLYHFTVGGPVEDRRLQTIPPYAHLEPAG